MKKIHSVVGYPRSGNNWLCYCLSKISNCGISQLSYAHGNTFNFWKNIANNENNLVFIIRNYKECIVRHTNANFKIIKMELSGSTPIETGKEDTDYISLMKLYDSYSENRKYLVYYDELIKNPERTLNNLLKFTQEDSDKLNEFMKNYDYHKNFSLKKYSNLIQPPITKGEINKITFHRNKLSINQRHELDNYINRKFPNLFEKYLIRYAE